MLSYMSTTLTIRIAPEERKALKRKAAQIGQTVSELVRGILRQGLAERTVAAKAGHLKGRLELKPSAGDFLRGRIRTRNWR